MCLFDEGDSSMNQPIPRKIWFEWINLVPVAWFAVLQINFGALILRTMLYIQWISLDIADKRDPYTYIISSITSNKTIYLNKKNHRRPDGATSLE